ncbi:hypothetical protein C8R41DRAFT_848271 [Lentinula lateritia]|uniref:Uncharacterized protein n=1 Tax=Lentinula lateritia TaxID=40482 RepID=A0ABQ8V6Z9_9AGAR|nr:hypothetical protein C8R41DRAFT_848271 [Lentinula lateritia]
MFNNNNESSGPNKTTLRPPGNNSLGSTLSRVLGMLRPPGRGSLVKRTLLERVDMMPLESRTRICGGRVQIPTGCGCVNSCCLRF